MENKCKRFLSLLLALVMVIGMMPMGQARAEESAAPVISAAAEVVGGSYVSLADCEYTFEKTGDTITKENDPAEDDTADSWYISSWVGGTQYYVDAYGTAQKPHKNTKCPVGIVDLDSPEDSVRFFDKDGYLHFHTEGNNQYWNQCTGTHDNNEAVHSVMIFERGEDTASPIPGYKQVTTVEDIDDGGRYLIVAQKPEGDNKGYYAMHPTAKANNISVNNANNVSYHAAKIVTNVELVTLNLGETKVITVPGNNTDVSSENATVVTVEGAPALTRYTVATTATQPDEDGNLPAGQYVFLNRRMGTALESNPNGTKLWMAAYPSTAEVWTVKAVADGYTVMASNGKYLTIGNETAGTTDAPTTLTFAWNKGGNKNSNYADAWSLCVKNVDEHLCQFGSATAKVAAGYEQEDDEGAQWDLYAVTPAQEYTWTLADETVTAIDPGNYYIFESSAAINRDASLVSAQWSDTNAGGGGSSVGLKMQNTKGNFNEKNVWKITASTTEGKYNVQDLCGWNMFIASGKAMVTPQSHPATVAQGVANVETWQITNDDTVYLHWWGIWNGTPSYTQIAGWDSKNGANSQWNIYKVTPTPVDKTDITFTAVAPGNTTVTHGDKTYVVHVHDAPTSFNEKNTNCGEKTNGCEAGTYCSGCEVTLSGGAEVKWAHSWNAGACGNACGTTWNENDFLANIGMKNDLEMCFAFEKALMADWTDCYAKIVKEYADDRGEVTLIVPLDEWKTDTIKGKEYYFVAYKGVAAKEMTDEFRVTICNAEGQPLSATRVDSIQAYAHRVLEGESYQTNYKKVVVDMLNYGAEAQKVFGYNNAEAANLANAKLTDEQKALGTQQITMTKTEATKSEGNFNYKANVKMVSNLQFMMAFSGINPDTMEAYVTFNKWDNTPQTVTIDGSNFVKSGSYYYFTIEETVVADGRQKITCEIWDKQNNEKIYEVTDSIAWYASRTTNDKSLYEAIMKFSDSARAYLEAKSDSN